MRKANEDLANAIVFTAVRDYQRALCDLHDNPTPKKVNKANKLLTECKEFFFSDWCKMLTKLDGDVLMEQAEKQIRRRGYSMASLKATY